MARNGSSAGGAAGRDNPIFQADTPQCARYRETLSRHLAGSQRLPVTPQIATARILLYGYYEHWLNHQAEACQQSVLAQYEGGGNLGAETTVSPKAGQKGLALTAIEKDVKRMSERGFE